VAERSPGAGLRSRTRRIDHDVDLLAICGDHGMVFTHEGSGLGGRGVALRVPVSEVAEALLAIDVEDPLDAPGTGPVAFCALPFLSDPAAEVFVPRICVGRDPSGTRWVTTVWVAGEEEPDAHELVAAAGRGASTAVDASLYREEMGAAGHPGDGPSSYEVTSVSPPQEWCAAVERATERIHAGALDKVVLAREVRIPADAGIGLHDVLTRLRARFGGCYLFAVDGFCGASPELLVARAGDLVRSQPMAGTAPHTGDPDTDHRLAAALLASATYRHEHQVTIDAVHDTLLPFSSYLDYEPEPSVVPLANVAHLATTVQGRLSHPPASVLELRDALHPTPAVCGRPRDSARALIAELEPGGRGRYAGSVGWLDRHGNGTWAVSIRCAQIDGPVARLHAGNGIVGSSDPATELAETRAKLQAMLGAIIRP
jgi:menaquinone-specific isochorismate synthase